MKDYFVLTYSKDCNAVAASNAVKILQDAFPDKYIIALPETINFKDYTKEELTNFLKLYLDCLKGFINE